jgi:hypothetical protein
MKRILSTIVALALAGNAWGGFELGDLRYNPALDGTGLVGDGGDYYNTGTPAWLAPENLLASLTSPIEGIPGFAQFSGFVDSFAYRVSDQSVGLVYRIRLTNESADRLVRASLGPEGWTALSIYDAGAEGTGNSAPQNGAITWTDGRPYFIARDEINGYPSWNYRFGPNGTVINHGQQSSLTWFETSATPRIIGPHGRITLQDGGAIGGALVLTVPEPVSIVGLLGTGAALLVARRLRRV